MIDPRLLWAGVSKMALDIPIEIRDEDFVLVRRTTIGSLIDHTIGLKSGNYTMTACLPTGHQLVQVIPVDETRGVDLDAVRDLLVQRALAILKSGLAVSATTQTIAMLSSAAPISYVLPAIKRGLFAAFRADPPKTANDLAASLGLEGMGPSPPPEPAPAAGEDTAVPLNYRLFSGSLSTRPVSEPDQDRFEVGVEAGTATMKNELPYAVTVQLLQIGEPALNVILPSQAKMLVKIPRPAKTPSLTMLLDEAFIDELIELRTAGYLSEAVAVAQSIDSAQIVDLARTRPAAAIAAAYIVLRTGQFDVACSAIEDLSLALPVGTDMVVLLAELNARKGRHPQAARGFLRAAKLGLPVASAGLGYLIDRLRFYCASESSSAEGHATRPDTETPRRSAGILLRECLDKVQPFAFRCDFTLPFTNYTGLCPDRPDDKELDSAAIDRMDVLALQLVPT